MRKRTIRFLLVVVSLSLVIRVGLELRVYFYELALRREKEYHDEVTHANWTEEERARDSERQRCQEIIQAAGGSFNWSRRTQFGREVHSILFNKGWTYDEELQAVARFPEVVRFGTASPCWSARDKGLDLLKGLEKLESVGLTAVNDEQLASVGSLTQVHYLGVLSNDLTDDGLAPLAKLSRLEHLELRTDLKGPGLRHLRNLTCLKKLTLNCSSVTDASLEYLPKLTCLEELKLDHTAITDAGLVHLEGLTNLAFLSVMETKVTTAGLERLQGKLPKLILVHRGSTAPFGNDSP